MQRVNFDGRVAIVTGAGGGLGRSYAVELAARGAAVVINDIARDGVSPADDVVAQIRDAGGRAVASHHSVTEDGAGAAIVDAALSHFGRLDILINNAGFLRDRSFAKLSTEDIDDVLGVHLRGAFRVSQPAFVAMKERGYGRIVFTSSSVGLFGNFGQANYAAAKLGLVGLARSLAVEGAKAGIRVNVVAPSAATGLTKGMYGQHEHRFRPEQVTPMTLYLASEECAETGEIFWAGGGRFAQVRIVQSQGWVNDDGEVTVEDIRDRIEQIGDETDAFVPVDAMDELRRITSQLGITL
jgi:NAD(P)-dependent dehydrogenase (short-subunit alcohol dehydrogenase family)